MARLAARTVDSFREYYAALWESVAGSRNWGAAAVALIDPVRLARTHAPTSANATVEEAFEAIDYKIARQNSLPANYANVSTGVAPVVVTPEACAKAFGWMPDFYRLESPEARFPLSH